MSAQIRYGLRALSVLALLSLTTASAQILIGPPAGHAVDNAEQVHAGDLNGDGHLDLFVVPDMMVFSDNFAYSVALGNGDGTFAAATVTSTQSSYWGRGELADLDDDGDLDFIVPADTQFLDPHVRVLLGAGDGTFPTVMTLGAELFSGSVCVVRDLNDDGDLDIIKAVSGFGSSTLKVYLADGNAPSGYVERSALTVGGSAILEFISDVDTADLDGDGFLEIVATSFDSIGGTATLCVLDALGPATWAAQVTSALPQPPNALALTDLDGNGDVDAVVRDVTGNVLALLGNGDTTFAPAITTSVGPGTSTSAIPDIAVGDLDADGTPDVIVPLGSETTVLRGLGDGTFTPVVVSHTYVAQDVALGDLDEDGDIDLAVAGATDCGGGDCPGQVFVLSNETYPAGSPFTDLGEQLEGANGYPIHIASGTLATHTPFLFDVFNAPPLSTAFVVVGVSELSAPFKGGTLVPNPDVIVALPTDAAGRTAAGGLWPGTVPSGLTLWLQWWFNDVGGVAGKSSTSALRALTP